MIGNGMFAKIEEYTPTAMSRPNVCHAQSSSSHSTLHSDGGPLPRATPVAVKKAVAIIPAPRGSQPSKRTLIHLVIVVLRTDTEMTGQQIKKVSPAMRAAWHHPRRRCSALSWLARTLVTISANVS